MHLNYPNPYPRLLLALLLILFLLLSVSSCTTLEKAVDRVTESPANASTALYAIKAKQPLTSASFFANAYPIVPKVIITRDTVRTLVTIPGDSVECETKTVYVAGKATTVVEKAKCPDVSYYLTTISTQQETISENTAAIKEKELELGQKNKEIFDLTNSKAEDKARYEADIEAMQPYKWIVWIVAALVVAGILWKFLKR